MQVESLLDDAGDDVFTWNHRGLPVDEVLPDLGYLQIVKPNVRDGIHDVGLDFRVLVHRYAGFSSSWVSQLAQTVTYLLWSQLQQTSNLSAFDLRPVAVPVVCEQE